MARNGGTFSRRRRTDALCDISPLSDTHQVHVLAVDDSLVDRKVIERLLKITSCKVTAVDSGWRALQFLGLDEDENSDVGIDGLKVDMIITDYCMPGMTGYELLKRIKGSSTFREVPVVIMSSENVVARIDRCLEEGAEDFIVKPVQLSDVKRLKDCMFGENRMEIEDRGINKRKLEEMSDLSFSPSPVSISPSVSPSPPFISPAVSPPPSPPPISPSSSPSPPPFSSSLSPPSSISSSFSIPSFSPSPLSIYPTTSSIPQSLSSSPSPQPSTPCSPSLLDSPIMRLTVTNCD